MFKGLRSRSKEKFEFRLRFHATRLPPLSHECLHVSLYQDTGRLQSQTSRAGVKNGACQWVDMLTEVVKLTRAKGSKAYDAKHYRLVVASGPSKASILGEASLNLADFAAFSQLDQRSLPLRCCEAGSVLHVTVHSIPLENRHAPNSHSDDESESLDGAAPRSPLSLSFTRHRPYDTESEDDRGDEREDDDRGRARGTADDESEAEERMYARGARSRSGRYSSSVASEPADSLPATPVSKPAIASAAALSKLQLFTGSERSLTAPSTPPRSLHSPRTPPPLAQVTSGPSAPDFSLSPPPTLRAHHLPPRKHDPDYARDSDRDLSDATPAAPPPPAPGGGFTRGLSSPRASPRHSSLSDVSPPLEPPPFLHSARASSRPSSPMRAAGSARMGGAGGMGGVGGGWRGEGAGVGGVSDCAGSGSVSGSSSSVGGWSIARGSSASISRSSSCASSHGGWSMGSFRGAQSPVSRKTLLADLQQQQQQAGGMGPDVKATLAQAERKVGASGTEVTRASSGAGAGGAGQGAGMRNAADGMALNARVNVYGQAESGGRSAGSSATHPAEPGELRGAEAGACRISRSRSVNGGAEGGNDALVAADGAAARVAEESNVPGWQVERLRAQIARARAQQTKVEEERDRLAEELRRAQAESRAGGSGGAGGGGTGTLGATTSSSSNGSGSGLWGSGWEASGGEGSGGEGAHSSTDGGESSGREAMEEALRAREDVARLREEVSRVREEARYYKDVSARLTAQVDMLRSTNDSLKQEARQATEDASKARREAQELAAAGRERERALRRMEGAAEEKDRAWRDRLQRLAEERGDLETKLRRAEAEREEAEEQLRALSDSRRGGNGESAGGSAEELRELRARVAESEREVEELTQESLQLAAGLSAARRDVAEREARIKELQVQVSVLQRWERREERRSKGGDDGGVRRREEGGGDESSEGAEQVQQLQQQLRRQEEQAQAAEEQARRLEEQVQAAEEQARRLEEQVQAAEEQAQAADEQARRLEELRAELEAAVQRGREQAEEAEKRAEQLTQQLADAHRAAYDAEEAQKRAEGKARLAEMSAERLGNRVRALTPLEGRVGELEEELRVGMERVRVQERVKAEAEARARQQAELLAEVRVELEDE
ncbi:hypothetical protein CLOM_g5195, partial [Closterium sp. NIES-68]